MKKSLIIFLLLLFSGGLKTMAQLPWSDAPGEPELAKKWPGYTNITLDTVIDKYRYIGEFHAGKRNGPWEVLDTQAGYSRKVLAIYSDDSLRFIAQFFDNRIFYRIAGPNKIYKLYWPTSDGIGTIVIDSFADRNLTEEQLSDWWVFPTNTTTKITDTALGLKKINATTFENKAGNRIPIDWAQLTMDGYKLEYSYVRRYLEGNFKLVKERYLLPANIKYTKTPDGNILSINYTFPIVPSGVHGTGNEFLVGSRENNIITFPSGKNGNYTATFEKQFDNKTVLKGCVDEYGRPDGLWRTYHFQYTTVKGDNEAGAFGGKGLLRTEFRGVSPPGISGGTQTDFRVYLSAQKEKTLERMLFNLSGPYALQDYSDFIEPIWQPFVTTVYATHKPTTTDLMLEDKTGYQKFQELYYEHGVLKRAYLFAPNGSLSDSLNWNKDDFGERITNRDTLHSFRDHAMAKAYRQTLVNGIKTIYSALTQSNTNTKCSYCNRKVDPSSAFYIVSITCGGVGYPHEAVFCSRQCEFEYEKGYCRKNQ